MKQLETDGFKIEEKLYNVRIRCIIADAPARSFLKCTKTHNAYFGCERCYCKGFWSKRVVFDNAEYDDYTDATFKDQTFSEHHEGISPLSELNLGLITQVPID
jgi:hypothetical protein